MPPKWRRRKKMIKNVDNIMSDARPTDIIIPIMGATGSGKSTFINLLLRREVVKVGHELHSCTESLNPIIIEAENWANPTRETIDRRLIIVDTPGFDDTYVDDSEILRQISVWLAASYSDSMKLAGVIYLQEISQRRYLGTTIKNREVFEKLCGEDIMEFAVLGTTKWDLVIQATGQEREQHLKEWYWKFMLDHKAQMLRIENTPESAWKAVDAIIKKNIEYNRFMLIQKELVDLQKILPETEAGRILRLCLQDILERQSRVRLSPPDAALEHNDEADEETRRILREISKLTVSTPRRLVNFINGILEKAQVFI